MTSRDKQRQYSRRRRGAILDLYVLALAMFCVFAPWLFSYAGERARIDLWGTGALIAATSFAAIVAFSEWEEWITLLLGMWLVVAPWLLGFAHARAMHVCVATGGVIAYLAALQFWLAHYGDSVLLPDERDQTG
jgi:SPW repeat